MRELTQMIPDADALLTMEPEVLGAKILFLLRNRQNREQKWHAGNLIGELWHNSFLPGAQPPYPQAQREQIDLAIAEAWSWLLAQGLLVSDPYTSTEWVVLSRRALKFQDERAIAVFSVARMLRKEILQPSIANTVWGALMRGEFDVAVFQAMKSVEVSVHEALGKPENLRGVDLMRKAFHPQDGTLTDMNAEAGERQARSDLFAGTIGSFKNPHSHRNVSVSNPTEAIEAVMLANHLLRIIDTQSDARVVGNKN